MSKSNNRSEIVSVSEIEPFSNIISAFDGSAQFCIENPYFTVAGFNPANTDVNKFMGQHINPDGQASMFKFMNSPNLLFKSSGKGKTHHKNYVIHYTDQQNPKVYRISKPYKPNKADFINKTKVKIQISPGERDSESEYKHEDKILATFDYQIAFCLDILAVAHVLKINLKSIASHDDNEFMTNLSKAIKDIIRPLVQNSPKKGKFKSDEFEELVIDSKYIESFTKTPYRKRLDRDNSCWISEDDFRENPNRDEESFIGIIQFVNTLFDLTGDSRGIKKNFASTDVAEYFKTNECFMPTCLYTIYTSKTGEKRVALNMDATIYQDVGAQKSRWRITQITKLGKGGHTQYREGIKPQEVANLWGGDWSESPSSVRHIGVITMYPELNIAFYQYGRPKTAWRIMRFTMQRAPKATAPTFEDFFTLTPEADEESGMNENATDSIDGHIDGDSILRNGFEDDDQSMGSDVEA